MGHSVSKGKGARDEHLVRDIAYLRAQNKKQEKAYETLQKEHDFLKTKSSEQSKELEKIKAENEELKNALKSASVDTRQDSEDGPPLVSTETAKPNVESATENQKPADEDFSDIDSGVNVEQGMNLKAGDKVLSLHEGWAYYTATIVEFNPETLKYTVNWDDGDPTGRVQKYCDVALNKTPNEDEIGLGTLVLFPQGKYHGTEGNNTGGVRYHQGRITRVYKDMCGKKFYDGEHTKGSEDGKWVTYRGYSYEFKALRLEDLRVSPNIYDILHAEAQQDNREQMGNTGGHQDDTEYDVFISYSKLNSNQALQNGEVSDRELGKSISDYAALNSRASDPRWIKQQLVTRGLRVWMDESRAGTELGEMVNIMKRCKVIVACISNEYAHSDNTRMELQFTKKTIKKPILPIVVGGGEWQWQLTVVGLLIAGELYIDFTNSAVEDAKLGQLVDALNKHVHVNGGQSTQSPSRSTRQLKSSEVFISYCWTNSVAAYDAKQITQVIGNEFNDPRRIYDELSARDITGWIDIHHLTSAAIESLGMFEQIAKGLSSARLVLVFVSDEYSESDNCRMEFQFALKSLKKKVVPIVVGAGDKWTNTIIGMLVSGCEVQPIDMRDVNREDYDANLAEILQYCSNVKGQNYQTPVKERTYRAPKIGDKVICHHFKWAYFPATVVSFDKTTFEYTVDWDDGDPTGRQESYKNVALNAVPREDEIAEGTIVFFPQGSYSGTEGNNTGGVRYHQGRVTKVYKNGAGETLYDGEHTKGEEDGKWVTYSQYSYNFVRLRLKDLRMSPNVMDALMAIEHQAKQQ